MASSAIVIIVFHYQISTKCLSSGLEVQTLSRPRMYNIFVILFMAVFILLLKITVMAPLAHWIKQAFEYYTMNVLICCFIRTDIKSYWCDHKKYCAFKMICVVPLTAYVFTKYPRKIHNLKSRHGYKNMNLEKYTHKKASITNCAFSLTENKVLILF